MKNICTMVLIILVLMLNGCGTNSTDSSTPLSYTDQSGGSNLSKEEPLVTFTAVANPSKDKANQSITGHIMSVSGVNPNGKAYSFPDFEIKGCGLQGISQAPYGLQQFTYPYMQLIAKQGGANCVRCYGAKFTTGYGGETPEKQVQDVKAALDWAREATDSGNSMYVAVGITMGDSKEIDYSDDSPDSGKMQQRAYIKQFIDGVIVLNNDRQLLWVIGNEIVKSSDHVSPYQEINTIAQYIKDSGSSLPCMTAVPTVTVDELATIAKYCTNLSILGVNDYYGTFGDVSGGGYLNTLNDAIVTSNQNDNGWKKPYIVSEYGSYDLGGLNMPVYNLPEIPYVPKGTYSLEANSTLIAQDYVNNYNTYIKPYCDNNNHCIGSFCYIWQNPVFSKLYSYFFEMFISGPTENVVYNPIGKYRLEAAEKMIAAWGGKPTSSSYPQIQLTDGDPQGISCSFKVTKDNTGNAPTVYTNSRQTASIKVTYDGVMQPSFNWYIGDNDGANHYNPQAYEGTSQTTPPNATNKTTQTGNSYTNKLDFNVPANPGNYQLRVNVTCDNDSDPVGQGTAATASVLIIAVPSPSPSPPLK